jgi:hypothetical protein
MSADDDLANEIATLSAHLDAATRRLLTCIRAFDETGGWQRQGAVSCAHWLSWQVGLDLVTAREKVRVARALAALPRIDQALERGELSYAKVRAITRAATPANEERLLEMARHSTGAQLDRICRGYRQVARSLLEPGSLPEARSVWERVLPGGMVRIELVLHPDEAALVMEAVKKAQLAVSADESPTTKRSSESPANPDHVHPPPARSSESLPVTQGPPPATQPPELPRAGEPNLGLSLSAGGSTNVARDTARASAEAASTPTPTPTPTPAPAPGPVLPAEARQASRADAIVHLARAFLAERAGAERGAADPHQIFVHLDQDVLGEAGAYTATLDDGTRLPAETLRRLACDAGLVATRTDGAGGVLDIGRRTRSIPPALRRALWLRDRGCRFPGCSHRRFLHGHHVRHWLGGGSTSLTNLVLLCSRHHRLVHEGGFTIERVQPGDALAFRAPRGPLLPAIPPPEAIEDAVAGLHDWATERGLEIGPDTGLSWWDGAVPDYDWDVSALLPDPPPASTPA